MIRPVLQDDAFLADVRHGDRDDARFCLWWLGQSGFLLQWRERRLLFDPYLSDSLTTKYANSDRPHVRMTERVVDPARLDFVDFVTSSHNHTDHLDAETLIPLLRANPGLKLVAPAVNRQFIADRLSAGPSFQIGLSDGESVTLSEFRVTAVPAAHEQMGPECLGYIVQFGPWTVYHSGDTLFYDGMVERLRRFKIDVALLPINGRAPERRVAGNMTAREAALLGKAAGIRIVIPCHYEMFAFNTADPAEFAHHAASLGQRFYVPRAGERWESPGL